MSFNSLQSLAAAEADPRFSDQIRPTREVALLFPGQGEWSEDEYLRLETLRGDHVRVELVDGCLEVLPAPTTLHQAILIFLLFRLEPFVSTHKLGRVSMAGLRVRLTSGKFREPDLVFLKSEHENRCLAEYWEGADLVMEVVSGGADDRKRDYVDKVRDYAESGISEYWIVDPEEQRIRVLRLDGAEYTLHGDFGPENTATSAILPGFGISVGDALRGGL